MCRLKSAQSISGIATLRQLSASTDTEWRKIIAISRRAPLLDHDDSRITFRSVDLLSDPQKVMEQLRETGAEETTHVFFYAYIAKQDEMELIEINRDLLGNVGPHQFDVVRGKVLNGVSRRLQRSLSCARKSSSSNYRLGTNVSDLEDKPALWGVCAQGYKIMGHIWEGNILLRTLGRRTHHAMRERTSIMFRSVCHPFLSGQLAKFGCG